MSPFLRKERNKLIKKKKMNGYLKYAFGEIILVVIGILIAMYIRSEYEIHQENKKIESSGIQVIDDLRKDTATIKLLLKAYEPVEKDFLAIMSDTMQVTDYDTCNRCPYLVSSINPFSPSQEGYAVVKTFNPKFDTKIDSLLHNTKRFYSVIIPSLDLIVNLIKEDVADNLNDWKNTKPWYFKWINGELNAEMDLYFSQSKDYKNKVANHYLLVYKNYIPALKRYSTMATKLADEWEEVLSKNKSD